MGFCSEEFQPQGIMRLRAGNAIEKSKVRFLEYDFLTGIYGQQKFYQRPANF